ncbi:hypothetical protein BGX33_003597 [Mortierella sp. NVP41]|nr:hypothetical protein BGX33_003597 [Mortierella sp. NVP41]
MSFQQQQKVFGVTEILSHIVSFLPAESLFACLQVSRHFHSTIAPITYSYITLGSMPVCRPSLEALRRYHSLVITLAFDGFISAEYLGIGFRNFKTLSLTNYEDSHHFRQGTDEEITEVLLEVIRESPRLTQWAFENPDPPLSAEVWKAIDGTAYRMAVAEEAREEKEVSLRLESSASTTRTTDTISSTAVVFVPQGGADIHKVSFRVDKERVNSDQVRSGIELLRIVPKSISKEALPWASSACDKAEALSMIPAKLVPYTRLSEEGRSDRVLPRPKDPIAHYVGLHNVDGCCLVELEFLSQFNQARGIYWNVSKRPFPRHLGRLPPTLGQPETNDAFYPEDKVVFPDDCVAYALGCIPQGQLQTFWWYGSQMGPLGIEMLADHFSTLQEIKLELTSSLEQSAYIQRIMESCPQLQVLRAGNFSVGDMRRGRPWVCLGLKCLSLRFDMQEDSISAQDDSTIGITMPTTVERERSDYEISQRYVLT